MDIFGFGGTEGGYFFVRVFCFFNWVIFDGFRLVFFLILIFIEFGFFWKNLVLVDIKLGCWVVGIFLLIFVLNFFEIFFVVILDIVICWGFFGLILIGFWIIGLNFIDL